MIPSNRLPTFTAICLAMLAPSVVALAGCGAVESREPTAASAEGEAATPSPQRSRGGRQADPGLLCKPGMTDTSVTFDDLFREHGVEGSLLIYDQSGQRCYQHEGGLNRQSYAPASTFKIFNALVALETGTVADEHETFTWDGVERTYDKWNQDLDLERAVRFSAVWVFQEIAGRVGRDTMQGYLDRANYGNRRIGDDVTTFWLDGSLRVTPEQQVKLLKRLAEGSLPFSERSQEIVRRILVVEETEEYVLRAKTGWATRLEGEPDVGWWVGYLSRADERYFFATRIDLPSDDLAPARIELTRGALERLGLLP